MGSVRKRGKTWNAQVRVSGWRSFTKSFKSKSDALSWIKALENNLKSTDIPKVNIRNITLKDLLQRYATEMSLHLKGSEVQMYVLNFYARHPIGQIKLSDLTERHFEYLRDERLRQVKHGTVHAQLMLLKRVFRTAIFKWGYGIPKNPIEQLPLPPTHKSRKRRLVGNEKERLLYAACSQKNIYIAFIIEFAIETGMRRSEILKLRWHDIDFTNGFAFLYDTKNGEDRKVPLTKRCMKLLQKVPQSHEKVFPITANCLRLAWGRARAKAEIRDLRFHDLRHEAISRMFDGGMTVPEVASISGHRTVSMLFRYAHADIKTINNKLNL